LPAIPPRPPPQELLRVDAELRQEVTVLLGVDLIRKLLVGLLRLAAAEALPDHLEDRFLGYLRRVS
jgi:hypothetical protein